MSRSKRACPADKPQQLGTQTGRGRTREQSDD
jgi:hypothetical protein